MTLTLFVKFANHKKRLFGLGRFHPTTVLSSLLVFVFAFFYHTIFNLFLVRMALTRLPLPSFTLVLTSGPQSLVGYPATIKLESSSYPAMRPIVRDHLMVIAYLTFVF